MKQNYLLPHGFKRVGLIMLVPFLAACIWLLCGPCEGDWFLVDVPALFTLDIASTSEWFGMTATDPVNEICMLGLLVSLVFLALSKEKDEDEMIAAIIRKCVSLTAFIAFGLFILINLIIALAHGFGSLNTLALALTTIGLTNVLTFIIIYLTTFRISLWKMRRQCKEGNA